MTLTFSITLENHDLSQPFEEYFRLRFEILYDKNRMKTIVLVL